MTVWRLGIVGCGGAMLCIHLPILQQLSQNFKIIAICDIDAERLNLVAERIGNVRIHSNIESMLEEDIDMVVILSQNHEDFIEKSLQSNKHVFTEKPVSLDLQYSYELQKMAVSRGLMLEVGLMRLHDKVVEEFYKKIPPESIKSGVFFKSDGIDALVRRSLLPKKIDTYNFHKSAPPIVPDKLNNKQILILKTLLWSGIHLMATLCQKFREVYVLACFSNEDVSSVVCILTTPHHQQFTLTICNTNSPIYIEDVRLISEHRAGSLEFSSPYIMGGLTQGTIVEQDDIYVHSENITNYEPSFFSMWGHIARTLEENEKKNSLSLDIALQVESLARQAAEMCV